ncbi:Hypothetical predicted protein [Paramuricea clavata]|uniref:Uncharacterized protein n=1 Tax=Paramuricea clavata TaxID=317549 RepID=A0A7D9EZ00_PARCT|nr:Hypothetical predicted protein [Paramuricea clavata]
MAARGDFRLYCLLFLFIYLLSIVSGRMSKKLYPPMKEDIPFIKCDVCQKAVKYLFRKAKSMREDTTKIGEEKLQDLVDKACNPEKFEGEWLAKLDIEEKKGELQLSEQEDLGSCKAECRTVAKACDDTVGDADTDIAEELWKNELTLSQLINEVCYSDTNACSKTKINFKSGSRKDEKFQVMSDEEKQAQEYLKKASDMPGMPNMQMYSREEMMEEMSKQQGSQSEDEPESDSSEYTTHPGGDLSIWDAIVQLFKDIWNWIRDLLGIREKASGEL